MDAAAIKAEQAELLALNALVAELRFHLALRRFSRKYREDQPRDDHGRWVDEGGQECQSRATPDQGLIRLAQDITGFTRHGINQAITRGVSPSAIHDAVVKPLEILPRANGTTRYIGAAAVVVLDPAGRVITV
jgi:hypothetical protein